MKTPLIEEAAAAGGKEACRAVPCLGAATPVIIFTGNSCRRRSGEKLPVKEQTRDIAAMQQTPEGAV